MNHLAHWTLLLWVPPVVAVGLWSAFIAEPLMMSTRQLEPVWIVVLLASLVSPVVAGIYWLTHLKEPRAAIALVINACGLAFNAFGLVLAAGHAAG